MKQPGYNPRVAGRQMIDLRIISIQKIHEQSGCDVQSSVIHRAMNDLLPRAKRVWLGASIWRPQATKITPPSGIWVVFRRPSAPFGSSNPTTQQARTSLPWS